MLSKQQYASILENAAIAEACPQYDRHWLPYKWTLWLLKITFCWGGNTSLVYIIIMEDIELLIAYFGSAEKGRSYLGRLEEWHCQDLKLLARFF